MAEKVGSNYAIASGPQIDKSISKAEKYRLLTKLQTFSEHFTGLSVMENEALVDYLNVMPVEEADFVIRSNQQNTNFVAVVYKGSFTCVNNHDPLLNYDVKPGGLLGEMELLLPKKPSQHTIIAERKSLLLTIFHSDLAKMNVEQPDLGLKIYQICSRSGSIKLQKLAVGTKGDELFTEYRSQLVQDEKMALVRACQNEFMCLGSELTKDEVAEAAQHMFLAVYKAGEQIIKGGQLASAVLVILKGTVQAKAHGRHLGFKNRGDIVGEDGFVASLYSDGHTYTRACDVFAYRHCTVGVLNHHKLSTLSDYNPTLSWKLHRHLTASALSNQMRASESSKKTFDSDAMTFGGGDEAIDTDYAVDPAEQAREAAAAEGAALPGEEPSAGAEDEPAAARKPRRSKRKSSDAREPPGRGAGVRGKGRGKRMTRMSDPSGVAEDADEEEDAPEPAPAPPPAPAAPVPPVPIASATGDGAADSAADPEKPAEESGDPEKKDRIPSARNRVKGLFRILAHFARPMKKSPRAEVVEEVAAEADVGPRAGSTPRLVVPELIANGADLQRIKAHSIAAGDAGPDDEVGFTKQAAYDLLVQAMGYNQIFNKFESGEIRVLSRIMQVLHLKRGEDIMHKGEQASFFCLVLSGTAKVVVEGIVVETVNAGSLVGELALFVGGKRMASVVSSDCNIAVFPYTDLLAFTLSMPELGLKMTRSLAFAGLAHLKQDMMGASEFARFGQHLDNSLFNVGPDSGLEHSPLMIMMMEAFGVLVGRRIKKEELEVLKDLLPCTKLDRGECVLRKGQYSTCVLIVLEGSLQTHVGLADSAVIGTTVKGDFAGETALMQDAQSSPMLRRCNVYVASEHVYCSVLTFESLLDLNAEHPKLAKELFMKMVGTHLQRLNNSLQARSFVVAEKAPAPAKVPAEAAEGEPALKKRTRKASKKSMLLKAVREPSLPVADKAAALANRMSSVREMLQGKSGGAGPGLAGAGPGALQALRSKGAALPAAGPGLSTEAKRAHVLRAARDHSSSPELGLEEDTRFPSINRPGLGAGPSGSRSFRESAGGKHSDLSLPAVRGGDTSLPAVESPSGSSSRAPAAALEAGMAPRMVFSKRPLMGAQS